MARDPWRRDEGKVSDRRRSMEGAGGPLRLREWLVAQIESGRYAGLRWEDAGKTLFRIPWKHAAKQGYQVRQDAALFRAWAIYKGKHLEGIDKEDPSTWKTRLRCALNKSADFCEVRERSQLDISNPYKVYRLLSDGAHDPGYQAQNPAHPWGPLRSENFSNPDCWLHVRLFYRAELVREATALAAEGCRLSPRAAAAAAERLLGPPPRVAQVRFPEPPAGAHVLRRLLPHLEHGVLLWVAPEGVFAKRLCQGRVYWRGPLAPHRARPNKLERERTCQLLDTRRFLAELRAHLQDGCPEPEYQIRLCFGEEYPGPPDQPEERLIMAHVEPVFARELLLHSKIHGQMPRWQVPSIASPAASLTC
ncbi:interferon regulatory factor 4-like isoform 5-T5 [Dama dama]|uniref:interferon regulatory factor 4-like isoform X4 n=1 Tax=Dama dama TaxID=30532 RepID=UPI002A35E542|nr:interferon regulatory factor 4-like isoform X4 [Dama dama]